MNRGFLCLPLVVVLSTGILFGCAAKEASSQDAINKAKTMETVEEQTKYLMSQAKAFYNSREFQDAIDSAQYVLKYLDKDSEAAKDLFERAKRDLKALAEAKTAEARRQLGL